MIFLWFLVWVLLGFGTAFWVKSAIGDFEKWYGHASVVAFFPFAQVLPLVLEIADFIVNDDDDFDHRAGV